MSYQDILFEANAGAVVITINRPEVHNAFAPSPAKSWSTPCAAAWDKSVGVIVLTGAGGKAFCTGGDQKSHGADGYGGRGTIGLPIEELHSAIRDAPKPVIAKEARLLHRRRQRAGHVVRFDARLRNGRLRPGRTESRLGRPRLRHGLSGLSPSERRKAREMWYLCRRYPARGARHGPHQRRRSGRSARRGGRARCAEIVARSPTAIALAKQSLNADSEHIRGLSALGMQCRRLITRPTSHRKASAPFRKSVRRTFASTCPSTVRKLIGRFRRSFPKLARIHRSDQGS